MCTSICTAAITEITMTVTPLENAPLITIANGMTVRITAMTKPIR